jgi:hypothetical protein
MTATSAGAGFTAPSSGRVLVVFRGRLRTTTSGDYSALGLAIREGTTTVGGGSPFTNSDGVAYGAFSSYDDTKSVSLIGSDADSGDAYVGMGTSYMVWGLTGGSAYNAIFYHANSDTVNLTITNVMLQIIPMP